MRKVHAIFAEFRWTIRVVWSSPAMFLTSATCHLFEKRWCESVITAVAVSRGACRHRLHFAISRKIRKYSRSFRRLSCVAASRFSHFALYQHPPPNGPARRTSHWHLKPKEASNLDGPCMNPCGKKGQSVCFISVLFFVVFCAVLFYCYINCH